MQGVATALDKNGLVRPQKPRRWRRLIMDARALTGQSVFVVSTLWGGPAAGDLVGGPQPVDLVSLTFGGPLLACLVAVGRRRIATPN